MRKEKFLVSLVVIALIALVIGNVSSLATDLTNTENKTGGTLKAVSGNNTADENKADSKNESKNENKNAVGAVKDNTNNTANNTTNKTNNTTNKTNTNTNSVGKLPYAGSNTSLVFVVVALVASALYAYKKVSDYNV